MTTRVTISTNTAPCQYFHLRLQHSYDTPPTLDLLTWRTLITAALTQYLGLIGSATHIDILHAVEYDAWIRCPQRDAAGLWASLGGYIGKVEGGGVSFQIVKSSPFLMGITK
ncbi:hypothetical protein YB2330_002516 [Saitoella coloradoensis]